MEANSGYKEITVEDKDNRISFPTIIQYPTDESPKDIRVGEFIWNVSANAKIKDGKFPIVVISHGSGGANILYSSISEYLSKKGFIVAMPEHYGNNRNDNSLESAIENFIYRPRHISLTIDAIAKEFGDKADCDKIAAIGHSIGGYAALAIAGGEPYSPEGIKINTIADKRVKSIVLLAPASIWFKNSLSNLNASILIYSGEKDRITPEWNAKLIIEGAQNKNKVIWRKVEKANHFSFLVPFPKERISPAFLPALDEEGFDRAAFHKRLPEEIYQFLIETL